MSNRHTQGTWKAVYIGCEDWDLIGPITQEDWTLAAAAPDLLDALQSVIDFPADFFDRPDSEAVTITLTGWHLKKARSAITKATGLNKATGEDK